MTGAADAMKLLALLVHRGLVPAETVKRALAAGGDPFARLVESGAATAAQIEQWRRTDAGTRPQLTRYALERQLGEGATARVFAARDRQTGGMVALKVLKPELAREKSAVEKFVREAQALTQIESPHIVRGLRVAREGETVFCAMELIAGECLQDTLARQGRLEQREALRVVAQIGRALAALHAKGLVHRDVKPGNVMRTPEGRAVLIDLGFAIQGGDAGSDTTAGTVHYIAPEQARGQAGLDVRADIYALGATLYHLVTGSLPFEGGSSEEVLRKQVLESLSGERIRALGLAPQVHWLIEKMMAKEKEIRFQSPEELVAEIEACLARWATEADQPPDDPDPRKKRRIRWQ